MYGLCALVCLSLALLPTEGIGMTAERDQILELLERPDDAYFALDQPTKNTLMRQLLLHDNFEGMVIGAPQVVDTAWRTELPLLWLTRISDLRAWQVQLKRNCTLVVSDLLSGQTTLHYAFTSRKRIDFNKLRRSRQGPAPSGRAAESVQADARALDARTVANLPWRAGRYALSLISYDWQSNPVQVELRDAAKGRAETPGVPAQQARDILELCQDGSGVRAPSCKPSAATPRQKGPGVTLALPPQAQAHGQPIRLHGAARLLLPPGTRVAKQRLAPQEAAATPDAVVPVTLILVELDQVQPRSAVISVPLSLAPGTKPDDEQALAFSVDLESTLRYALPVGAYLVYAAVAGHLSAAARLTVE